MGQRFISADRDQALLLPPSLAEWLPAGHLAWLVLDAVDELDLAAFYVAYRQDGHGRPAHDPALMVAVLLYAYCKGVRSSREIERRLVEDVAFRVIAANLVPDHSTISRFVERHETALAGLFEQVLELCGRAGLVQAGRIAVDSTKLAANASGYQNKSYGQIAREILAEARATDAAEDEQFGDRRGDELPDELADPKTRKQRLRAAKAELEAEWQAQREADQEMMARRAEHERRSGRKLRGRPPLQRDFSGDPPGRVNLTDPESGLVKTPRGFIQGYNAHAAVTAEQIIVAAEVINRSTDGGMLAPMIAATEDQLTAAGIDDRIETVLADAGYWASRDIDALTSRGMTVLVPPDGNSSRPNPQRRGGLYQRMRERLGDPEGRDLYRRRQGMIEPVFGNTKHNRRIDRFRRRGLAACRAEWRLITATHNLLKLWRHSFAAAPAG
jgi:transposase